MPFFDLPPFGTELKTIMAVSHGYQDEFVSAGVVYAWMFYFKVYRIRYNYQPSRRLPPTSINFTYRPIDKSDGKYRLSG